MADTSVIPAEIITFDQSAFALARKKAIYGHRTWLIYQRRDGSYIAQVYTAAAIKAALLASGTRGRFWWLSANSGTRNVCRSWGCGIHLWRCARGWERSGYSAT